MTEENLNPKPPPAPPAPRPPRKKPAPRPPRKKPVLKIKEEALEIAAPSSDSGEARNERKAAARQAYAENPPEESRLARKGRGPKE